MRSPSPWNAFRRLGVYVALFGASFWLGFGWWILPVTVAFLIFHLARWPVAQLASQVCPDEIPGQLGPIVLGRAGFVFLRGGTSHRSDGGSFGQTSDVAC